MLEQCENLNEVELFLETKTSDGKQHKDANYILAILDSRKKFVAHERFQYVLLKKFGETDQQVNMFFVHLLLLTKQKNCILKHKWGYAIFIKVYQGHRIQFELITIRETTVFLGTDFL